jgi:hypothetical protein
VKLFCMIDDCPNFVHVDQSLAPLATYTCKNHTAKAPDSTRFQEYQWDPDLDSGSDPSIDFGDESLTISYDHRFGLDPDEDLSEVDEKELSE